jgi:predicted amidophosphoribosyltransferase
VLRVPGRYVHSLCLSRTYLSGVFSSFILNPNLSKYLKEIKYSFYEQMLFDLGITLKQSLANRSFKYDLISFVPQSRQKDNWRGFNPSKDISKILDFKSVELLKKIKNTKPQAILGRRQRLVNLNEAFLCIDSSLVGGKNIMLCDDIYTTGSTMESCAKVLKSNGAKNINA